MEAPQLVRSRRRHWSDCEATVDARNLERPGFRVDIGRSAGPKAEGGVAAAPKAPPLTRVEKVLTGIHRAIHRQALKLTIIGIG